MDQQISFVQYTDNVGKNQSYNRVYDPETATPKQRSSKKRGIKKPADVKHQRVFYRDSD